jgi:hypothetical protein
MVDEEARRPGKTLLWPAFHFFSSDFLSTSPLTYARSIVGKYNEKLAAKLWQSDAGIAKY